MILLTILFLILKIIFFIILAFLGIILILTLIILFVPISYETKFSAENLLIDYKDAKANIKIWWLFKIIGIHLIYEKNKLNKAIFIFGRNILKKRKRKKRSKANKEFDLTENIKKSDNKENKKEFIENKEIEQKKESNKVEIKIDNIVEFDDKKIEKKEIKQKIKPKAKNSSKIKYKQAKRKNKTKKSKDNIFDKINLAMEKINYYYNYPKKDIIIKTFKKFVFRIIKALKPKVLDFYLELGLDDLSLTGKILGFFAIVSGIINKKMFIVGNFEQKIIKVNIYLKGDIYIFKFLFAFLRFIFSKEIFRIIWGYIKDLLKKRKELKKESI